MEEEVPRSSFLARRGWWIAGLALLIGAALAILLIPYQREQRLIGLILKSGGMVQAKNVGPPLLREWAGGISKLFERAESVILVGPVDPEIWALLGESSNVRWLDADKAVVTDDDLKSIGRITSIERLYLGNTGVTDAGLAHLQGLSELRQLSVDNTLVGDAGLAHVAKFTNLQQLSLTHTRVTDPGLDHLHGLSNLKRLSVNTEKVSREGVAAVKAALPNCKIDPEFRTDLPPTAVQNPSSE